LFVAAVSLRTRLSAVGFVAIMWVWAETREMDHQRARPGEATRAFSGTPDLAADLKAASRGDQQAFARVYDATSAKVHGLVLRVLRNPALAEEVSQECYLEIWRQAARYEPERGSAMAWMLTLAHRRAVDRVRAVEASDRRDVHYERSNRSVAHDSTEEAAEARMEAHRVRAALQGLTGAQREAIELAYFGGYTHTEVAAMLDLPLGTAKTRIRDGLIRLRDTMGVGGQ
jgi:RNA polymerase sigma-70 factor (ECF subfamily)